MLIKICDMLGLAVLPKYKFQVMQNDLISLDHTCATLEDSLRDKEKHIQDLQEIYVKQNDLLKFCDETLSKKNETISKKNEIISQVLSKNDELQKQLQVNNLVCQSLVQLIDQLLEENFRLQNDVIILGSNKNV